MPREEEEAPARKSIMIQSKPCCAFKRRHLARISNGEIPEVSSMKNLDSDNKPGVYSKVVNVFQNQEDAIKHFLYLTNENHYTIMSYGRIS